MCEAPCGVLDVRVRTRFHHMDETGEVASIEEERDRRLEGGRIERVGSADEQVDAEQRGDWRVPRHQCGEGE